MTAMSLGEQEFARRGVAFSVCEYYRVGGIGPFGSRTPLPVHADLSLLDQDAVYINGGRRGLLLVMQAETLSETAAAELVDVASPEPQKKRISS